MVHGPTPLTALKQVQGRLNRGKVGHTLLLQKNVTAQKTFSSLEPFTDFTDDAFDTGFYTELPSDWLVVIADIENSTQAVSNGNYVNVNYVGAACITALNNALPGLDFPKVFGGDGAHAVVPPDRQLIVVDVLQRVAHWSQQQFGLTLITGVVPMQNVKAAGGRLSVGKLRSATGVDIAMFRGNGLDMAESMVKHDTGNNYRLQVIDAEPPDLSDLSCRWAPITPFRDHMLCIIVSAKSESAADTDATLSAVVAMINGVVELTSDETRPAAAKKLKFKLRLAGIKKEMASTNGSVWNRSLSVVAIHLFAKVAFAFKSRIGNFDSQQYQSEIAGNSDYIKVAGSVKMVLDCTAAQADQIEALLEEQFQSGQLVYGVFRAKQALMTCVTPDINSGNHMHYIDGSDGGLWQAATALKRRFAAVR